jgi:HK97 family phage portal protein
MSFLTAIREEYKRATVTRAISHRPDLAGRVHLLSSREDQITAPRLRDYSDYADVHATHVWVRKGIKILQDNFSPLPSRVVDGEGNALENHPLSEMLAHGNEQQGPADLKATWLAHIILGGECFYEVLSGETNKRLPLEFWPRRPDRMAVLPDANWPAYPRAAGYEWEQKDGSIRYEADEMIHWKLNNPLSVWRGLSLIGAARHSITIDIFAQAYSKKFLKEGGNPDVIIYGPQGMSKTEKEKISTDYNRKYQGWENWFKAMVIENEVYKVQPITFPPKDMEWIEQRKLSRDEIGSILGVPDVLMGWGQDTYDTEEKRTAALRTFWSMTLLPLVEMYDSMLNTFFTKRRPLLRGSERIQTDLSGVGVLQEDIAPKVEMAKSLWAMGVPFNVIDDRLGLGIGEIDGGDSGYLPLNLLPTDSAYEPPPATQPAQEAAAVTAPVVKANGKAPEYGSIEHRAYANRVDVLTRPFERRMVAQLKRYFQRQQSEVGQRLRDKAERKQEAPPVLPPVAELFDIEAEAALFREEMRPIIIAAFAEAGSAALELVLGAEAGEFAIDSRLVKQAIEFILEQHSLKTNNTTFVGLTDLFKAAEDEGASIPTIMDMLSQYFGGRKGPADTERIARTTMIASHNAASLQAYAQSGVVYGNEWLAALDSRVRDSHAAAHGQFRPIGGRFEVGGSLLQYPGDPAAAASETINCRCTLLPVTRFPGE